MQTFINFRKGVSLRNMALAVVAAATVFGSSAQTSLELKGKGMEPKGALEFQVPAGTPAASRTATIKAMRPVTDAKLIEAPVVKNSVQPGVRKAAAKADNVAADITGTWIMSYETLLQSGNNGGGAVNIVSTTVANTYVIKNFWQNGLEVAATFDPATGVFTIPNQIFATTTDGASVDVTAIVPATGAADRKTPITGRLNNDGTITIDTWWAVYLADKSEVSGGMFDGYYNTVMRRPNGQFSFTQDGETSTVPVYVNQPADNVLEVTNLLNGGLTIEMILNRDLTASIALQPILENNTAQYNICNAVIEDGNVRFTTPIFTAPATDKKVMTWTNWTAYGLTSSGKPSWFGLFTEGKLTLENEVSYPTQDVTSLKGSGTKDDPWLISSKNDLIYMADMINNQAGAASGALFCTGEYFRMTNDIDMSGYRYTAIASDYYHVFNGTFDGDGHTITGLSIVAPSSTYAGLFGRSGEQSLITNVTIKNANISAQAFAACAVAWSTGTVSNVNVLNSTVSNVSQGTGAVANIVGTITNCHADSCNITGLRGYVGGLAGQVNKTMTNCSATNMRIVGACAENQVLPIGGLVGLANYQSVMTDSYFSGTIDAASNYSICYNGGLAGVSSASTMERCFFVGTIRGYGADSFTGGLIGNAQSSTIIDCYVNGRVDNPSSRHTGGFTGNLTNGTIDGTILPGTIKNSYSSAAMLAENYLYKPDSERRELFGTIVDGAQYTIENCYFNKQLVNFGSTQYGVMTSDLVSAKGPAGFTADKWVFTEGQYPRLKGIDQNQAALYSASALIMDANSNLNKLSQDAKFNAMGNTNFGYLNKAGQIIKKGSYSEIVGDSLILNKDYTIGTDTLFIVNGRAQYHYFVKIAPIPFDGEGTEESPYLIRTKDDLVKLSQMTTVSGQTFPGTYFLMTNDIDLEYTADFLGIMCNASSTANFAGTFDGGGYAVHKMKLGYPKWTKEPTETTLGTIDAKSLNSYQGFIGRLDAEGSIRNFTLADDCEIILGGYSGAIVGYNFGRIENCRNFADVITYNGIYIGGITGYNNNAEKAEVVNCYNAGNILSGRYGAGGITGVNYHIVRNCVNTGNVSTKNICTNYTEKNQYLIGGITGSMTGGILENCINYGTITCNDRVGGLSGSLSATTGSSYTYHNDVINCINLGMVWCTSTAKCGAFGGESGTTGQITGNYWDAQVLPLAAAANASIQGMTGVNTSVLTSGKLPEGYSADVWDFTAGLYPTLKSRVNEEAVQKARAILIDMKAGENVYDMTGKEATLAAAEGLSWKLTDGTLFSINGNKLTGPAAVPELKIDTLVATYGNVVKPILLKAMPSMPLAGAGTEADPYLVKSADDWNALAAYMTQTNNSLDNSFITITNDIDFTDVKFMSLADGVTPLNGTLDGKGHTVKGIKLTATATFAGAIGTVGSTGVVKNLTLAGKVTSSLGSVGGFTGRLYGSLENCVNEINVSGGTKATAGGFAATAYDNATITDCVNKANVSAQSNVGGFVGTSDKASNITMTRCSNSGNITGNASSAYVAGIIGNAFPGTFTDCSNSGTVTVTTPTTQNYAGGLMGYANGYVNAAPFVITGCSNSGDITAKSSAAGLIANVHATPGYATLYISDCTNSGHITSKGTTNTSNTANAGIIAMIPAGSTITNCTNTGKIEVSGNTYTAGIVGYNRPAATAAKPVKITGCTNSGEVIGGNYYIGGIMGCTAAYTYVDSCSNTGNISGIAVGTLNSYAVGGITGAITNANAAITNSWNTGNVSTISNRAGGIVGMNAQKAQISDCWNGGEITTTADLMGTAVKAGYGIGGIAGQGSSIITRCYNYGTVKGVTRVGGIVGAPTKNNTQLISCYNAGRIEAPADTCGNLVGVKLLNNGSIWNTGNAITDSYYVTEFGVYDNSNGAGTAISMAQLAKTNIGDEWTIPADYSLPILKCYANNEAALLYSAAVVLSEGDTFDSVTRGFSLGTPGLVKWTSSVSELTIDGNTATFNAPYTGDIVLTATAGNLSRTFNIKAIATTTGIDSIAADNDEDAEYYNLQGIRVYEPKAGQIYIVRRGKTATKEVYRN